MYIYIHTYKYIYICIYIHTYLWIYTDEIPATCNKVVELCAMSIGIVMCVYIYVCINV